MQRTSHALPVQGSSAHSSVTPSPFALSLPRLLTAFLLSFCLLPATISPAGAQARGKEEARNGDKKEKKGLPLQPGDTISFDMTEGTWISLDVSPDGESIVFDYLGDLFTIPVAGGEATQLTSGMAFDAQPRFSPDAKRIVFTSDRDGGQNIWVMSVDGKDTVQISKGGTNRAESPEWTPDGKYIVASMGAFRGRALPKLKLFHVDGGTGIQLAQQSAENASPRQGPRSGPRREQKMLGAAVSPDGRYIWFARRSGDWQYNAQFPQYQLAVYDRQSGETYTRSSRYGSGIRPTLSPDGRWLVYGTRHDDKTGLILRDLKSGEEGWLAYPVQHDDQESRGTLDVLPGMSFTPDSRYLVTSYGGKIWKLPVVDVEEGAAGEAEEIPFRVRFKLPVGPRVAFKYPIEDTQTFTVRQIRDAVPSPDGSKLAFTALDRLWVSEADGSNPRHLTDKEVAEQFPAWSPDGRWLAYSTWAGHQGYLWKVRADGRGEPVRLTAEAGLYETPVWSPQGNRIVTLRGYSRAFLESSSPFAARSTPTEIVWVSANPPRGSTEGGPVRLIAPTDGRSGPHFTQDPDRIYFFKRPDLLVSLRWDGTDEKEHAKVRGPKPPDAQQALSPTVVQMAPRGDQALALIQRQIYTFTVPEIGKTPEIKLGKPKNAAFPARKLTVMGGEFPAWGADGRQVHWSLGNAHFVYDLTAAKAFEDSVKAAKKAAAQESEQKSEQQPKQEPDEAKGKKERKDPKYEPREFRVAIRATRDIPSGQAVLRGGRVITMRGDEVIENADILVADNRIVEVGARGSFEIPSDARVIDIPGTTVIPGFVDTHAHLRPAWGVHRSDLWVYMVNLAYGVTTTRDPQTGTTDVLTYSDMVRAGKILGPRIYSTGPGVFWQDEISSQEQAKEILTKYAKYFDTKTIKMYVSGNRRTRQWIIQAARELGLMPTTEGSLNFKQNLTETIDGYPGLEHSLPIYPVYGDVLKLFVETGRTHTPTLLVSYGGPWAENYYYSRENPHDDVKLRHFTPHDQVDTRTLRRSQWFRDEEHVFQDHARWTKALVEAGGKAGVGSHGQLQGLGYHWELWSMASGGLKPHDALRVATLYGAQAIGLDRDLGTIEPGKLADLVVLNRNPLDDLRNSNTIRYVMKNGRLYETDTLKEIYPREREIQPFWWWNADPGKVPGVKGGP